jgi:abelson tyrosine-protein kinase 1
VKIGVGAFADVYRGTWRGRTVAIKVLAQSTPRALFVREAAIWKTLQHRHVLPLYGASSAAGDPPWFFVSPYFAHGSLSDYLRRLPRLRDADVLRMMQQVARGMEYLHEKGVLHGDLKASNVLVSDHAHCVISDFGQSELKSEAYRLSGTPIPRTPLVVFFL